MTDVTTRRVSMGRLLRLMAERAEALEDGMTVCVRPGHAVPHRLGVPPSVESAVAGSDTGAVVFHAAHETHVVLPPFPVEDEGTLEGWSVDVLRDIFERPRRIGVLLLRMGGFAVGIYEGRELVSSKVGSRFVKGRHSKGGSSQARFARRREEQARALFGKACEVLRERMDAYPATLDHFLTGGDRRTIGAFEKECDYVRRFESVRLQRVLDVGDPKKATLDALPRSLYESVLLSVSRPGS